LDCAPRGYAKSTVKTLFKPIHDLCYGLEKYLLFISATKPQALGKLKDIRSELLTNDLLSDIYGLHFPNKNPGAENFIVISEGKEIYCHAVGAGTETRGIRFRENRPTKIILDDVEDSEEVENEEIREKVANWFFEVVSNLGSEDTNIEIVGTVLHRKSLLKRLEKNPAYTSNTYKAVISWASDKKHWNEWAKIYKDLDNDARAQDAATYFDAHRDVMLQGTDVLWPEKEPYDYLMREFVEKGKRAFMKEKQNSPQPSDEALFDTIHWYHEDEERGGIVIERTGGFYPYADLLAYGVIDPATGDTKAKNKSRLDYTCILGGLKDPKGRLLVHRDWTKRARPTKYLEQIFEMQDEISFEKFAVETNLYRGLLLENLAREKRKREHYRKKSGIENWSIRVPFYEIENREKKEKRIFTLEPKVNNGWILFNRNLSMEFMDQLEQFPSKESHDDGPDALEMLWSLINNRYKPAPINMDAMGSR
jgi:predicted phage terminase large subunit-like protein